MSDNTHSRAVEALKLHAAYEAVPGDRGGANGPKGKALAAWIAARDAVLASLPTASEGGPAPCMGMAQNCPWVEGVSTSCSCQRPAPSDQEKLAEALSKGGALMDEPAPTPSFPRARKVVIAFEDPDDSYDAMLAIAIAVRATRARHPSPAVSGEGWRPIETAPKDGWHAPILTCCVGDPVAWFGHEPVAGYAQPPSTAYWNEHGDCWTPCQRPHDLWEPTHWMPLLAPPSTSSDQIGREP